MLSISIAELYLYLVVIQPVIGILLFPLGKFSKKAVKALPILSLTLLSYSFFELSNKAWDKVILVEMGGFSFLLDSLANIFSAVVLLIGFLCILYSYGYMSSNDSIERYYFWMLTFIASMLLLVSANSILLLIASWELTGLCSFSLISHWNFKEQSLKGAYRALVITEIGSSMLIAGLFLLEKSYGISNVMEIAQPNVQPGVVSGIALTLIIIAIASKSVQYPLHIWLPDAMYAPTPVSALLHAATMVKAGVYLLARFWKLYLLVPGFFYGVFLLLGSLTMVIGGMFMLRENDLKRLLAYSTVSQIGYMISSLGLGTILGLFAGIYHLVNHAIVKGLLFLSAGVVEHETGTRKLKHLGGLVHSMPLTTVAFLVGALSLSGIPPLNCFVSKWIIYEVGLRSLGNVGVLGLVLVVAAFLSSVFTLASFVKASGNVFFGQRTPYAEDVHDPGVSMLIPLIALTTLAFLLGVYPSPLIKTVSKIAGLEIKLSGTLYLAGGFNSLIIIILMFSGILVGLALYVVSLKHIVYTEIFLCGEDIVGEKMALGMSGEDFYSDILEMFYKLYNALDPEKWLVNRIQRVSLLLEKAFSNGFLPKIYGILSFLVAVIILLSIGV